MCPSVSRHSTHSQIQGRQCVCLLSAGPGYENQELENHCVFVLCKNSPILLRLPSEAFEVFLEKFSVSRYSFIESSK